MSSFIISLDSYYRDAFLYPNISTYDIIVNPYTPSLSVDNANSSYKVDNPIYTSFQWIGKYTYPTTSLGYPVTLANNAVFGRSAQFFSLFEIRLDDASKVSTVDYYVGCTLLLFVPTSVNQTPGTVPKTFQTALIGAYEPTTNVVKVQTQLDLTFLTEVFTATQTNPTFKNYYVINTSFTQGNNLILLGLNSFLSDDDQNYVSDISLKTAPTTDMWVQNISKNWITSMYYLNASNRNAFLNNPSSTPLSGDLLDIYMLRKTDQVFSVQTTGAPIQDILAEAVLEHPGAMYVAGTVYDVYILSSDGTLTYNGLKLRALTTDASTGAIQTYEWVTRTSTPQGIRLQVGIGGSDMAILQVVTTRPLAVPISAVDGQRTILYANNTLFTVYIPIQGQLILRSFAKYDQILYVYGQPGVRTMAYLCLEQYTGDGNIPTGTYIQYMSYSRYTIGVVAPVIGYQQGVCYKVRLLSLILPNQPVQGINQLPSFFPFVMLQLYNTNMNTSSTNIMYSNNPHTQRVTFFCPVGNPRNQLISTYVVVRSTQENYIKWTSLGSLHIEVVLPDGTPLTYAENAKINDLAASYVDMGLPYQSRCGCTSTS